MTEDTTMNKPALSLRAHAIFNLALDVAHEVLGHSGLTTDYYALLLVGHEPFIARVDRELFMLETALNAICEKGSSTVDQVRAAKKRYKSERGALVKLIADDYRGSPEAFESPKISGATIKANERK